MVSVNNVWLVLSKLKLKNLTNTWWDKAYYMVVVLSIYGYSFTIYNKISIYLFKLKFVKIKK